MRNLFPHRGVHARHSSKEHTAASLDAWFRRALVGIKILSSHIPQQRVAYSMGKRGLRVPRSELRQPCLSDESEY